MAIKLKAKQPINKKVNEKPALNKKINEKPLTKNSKQDRVKAKPKREEYEEEYEEDIVPKKTIRTKPGTVSKNPTTKGKSVIPKKSNNKEKGLFKSKKVKESNTLTNKTVKQSKSKPRKGKELLDKVVQKKIKPILIDIDENNNKVEGSITESNLAAYIDSKVDKKDIRSRVLLKYYDESSKYSATTDGDFEPIEFDFHQRSVGIRSLALIDADKSFKTKAKPISKKKEVVDLETYKDEVLSKTDNTNFDESEMADFFTNPLDIPSTTVEPTYIDPNLIDEVVPYRSNVKPVEELNLEVPDVKEDTTLDFLKNFNSKLESYEDNSEIDDSADLLVFGSDEGESYVEDAPVFNTIGTASRDNTLRAGINTADSLLFELEEDI